SVSIHRNGRRVLEVTGNLLDQARSLPVPAGFDARAGNRDVGDVRMVNGATAVGHRADLSGIRRLALDGHRIVGAARQRIGERERAIRGDGQMARAVLQLQARSVQSADGPSQSVSGRRWRTLSGTWTTATTCNARQEGETGDTGIPSDHVEVS